MRERLLTIETGVKRKNLRSEKRREGESVCVCVCVCDGERELSQLIEEERLKRRDGYNEMR